MKLPEIFELMEKQRNNHEFLRTGFSRIDDSLDGGLLRKELVIIGAGTGRGKSYLAGQLAYNVVKQGFQVLYLSLEIANEMIVSRMMGAVANIKPTRLMLGLLTAEEYRRKLAAKAEVQAYEELLTFYDDKYTLQEIMQTIKDGSFDFIVIDFIQNIIDPTQRDEYSRLSKIALELQKLAKEKDCTIVCLSQLSNSANKEGISGKTLEYKGSGSIAMVCDLGFFMERIDNSTLEAIQQVNLVLKKNRRGSSGLSFNLYFKIPGGELYESA